MQGRGLCCYDRKMVRWLMLWVIVGTLACSGLEGSPIGTSAAMEGSTGDTAKTSGPVTTLPPDLTMSGGSTSADDAEGDSGPMTTMTSGVDPGTGTGGETTTGLSASGTDDGADDGSSSTASINVATDSGSGTDSGSDSGTGTGTGSGTDGGAR